MKTLTTWHAKADEVDRKWWIIDASNQTVGRLATQVTNVIRGKAKPTFTPNTDTGDFVVVINSDKMFLSGKKWDVKKYYRHSRFFGSMKELTAAQQKEKDSAFILQEAVRGMLPKNKMAYTLINKVKIYPTGEHPHAAQKPELMETKRGK